MEAFIFAGNEDRLSSSITFFFKIVFSRIASNFCAISYVADRLDAALASTPRPITANVVFTVYWSLCTVAITV